MYSSKAKVRVKKLVAKSSRVRFAIIGNARTGSSHLASLLDSHPQIACWDGEIFNRDQEFDQSGFASPHDFLSEIVFAVSAHAVGFKFLRDAVFRFAGAWHMLRALDIRLIHSVRCNALSSYVSSKLAALNNAYTCFSGSYHISSFAFNSDEFRRWVKKHEDFDSRVTQKAIDFALPIIRAEYAEVCSGRVNPILEFLDAPSFSMQSRLIRQRTLGLYDIIQNVPEARDYLATIGKLDWLDREEASPQ